LVSLEKTPAMIDDWWEYDALTLLEKTPAMIGESMMR
jgi:hypothetical protein